MPVRAFGVPIVLIVKWLFSGFAAPLHTDCILPCKGCDKYLKSQEKSVKNIKF